MPLWCGNMCFPPTPILPRRTELLGSGKNDMGLCYFADGKDYYRYLVCHNTGSASDLPALQDRILEKRQSDLQQAAAFLSENPQLKASQTTDPIATLNGLQEAMRANFPAPPETTFTVSSIDECMEDYMAPAFYITSPIDDYAQNSIFINASTDTSSLRYFTTLARGLPRPPLSDGDVL